MRVLHVNKFVYRRGGAEAYMLDLARLQTARGDEVELFGMRHPDNLPSRFEAFFPVEVDFRSPGAPAKAAALGRMLWSSTARRGLEEVVRRHRPEVAHLHNIYHHLSPSILRALAAGGVPIVLTMHDYKLVCPAYQLLDHGRPCEACIGGTLFEPLRRRCKEGSLVASAAVAAETALHRALGAYDLVDVLVSPSAYLAGRMTAGGIDGGRIEICPLFTVAARGSVRPSGGIGSGRVAFAGRLEPEKGADVLIRAIGRLPRLTLSVAGEGSAEASLRDLAGRVAPGRVEFLGRLDQAGIRALLAGVQTAVVPSLWPENQPLSLLEAMAAGAPVMASAVGGIPEVVADGRTGLLVPPGDWAALAASLDRLDRDRDLAEALSAAAIDRAAEYSPARHLERLDEIYATARERLGSPRRRLHRRLVEPPVGPTGRR